MAHSNFHLFEEIVCVVAKGGAIRYMLYVHRATRYVKEIDRFGAASVFDDNLNHYSDDLYV